MTNLNNRDTLPIHITQYESLPLDENKQYIYNLSHTVRILAVVDILLGLLMLLYSYLSYYILLRLVISSLGYIGAKNYNYYSTSIYLGFLLFGCIGELCLIYAYHILYEKNEITKNNYLFGIGYQLVMFGLKLYLTRFVCRFTHLIRNLNDLSKQQLIIYEKQPITFIYW